MQKLRTCSVCKSLLPLETGFYKCKSYSGGYMYKCKKCSHKACRKTYNGRDFVDAGRKPSGKNLDEIRNKLDSKEYQDEAIDMISDIIIPYFNNIKVLIEKENTNERN